MEIRDNYSILNLFVKDNKEVKIFINRDIIKIHLKTIKEFFSNDDWATCYTIISREDFRSQLLPEKYKNLDCYEQLKTIIFEYGKYTQYLNVVRILREQLVSCIENLSFDFQEKEFKVENVTITSDIWNYIIYILKLSCGEKEEKPLTFQDEYSKQLYLAQKEFEKKVHKIKSQNGGNDEQILKILLTISYQIPSLTFDYLFNQTMAQIHWLYRFAAQSVSYNVTSMAYAAGNLKKGKTPEFFIK